MTSVKSPTRPWLSVIIPTHQGERWIRDTLDSLARQTEQGFECIFIDSSPDDETFRIIESYADRLDMRIHRRTDLDHWRSKSNFGFEDARADHVCMLHQDDFWMPGRTLALRRWLNAAPDAAMHLNPSYVVDENGKQLGVWRCPLPSDSGPVPAEMMLERLLVQCFISIPAPVIRRDAFLAVGGLKLPLWYTADWDLYLKISRHGPVIYHSDILSCFRIHSYSLTVSGSRSLDDYTQQMRSVFDSHVSALPQARRHQITARALTAIHVNTCLAAANNGAILQLFRALFAIMRLGPFGIHAFLRDTRLYERVMPRVRAKLAGNM